MNSLQSSIINTRNNNKRASLAMSAQSTSFIKSLPIVNDYFVKFYTSNHCSMFDEQLNCINRPCNQRKDGDHDDHKYRRPVVVNNNSSNFRSTILNNNYHHYMKRDHRRISNLSLSKQRMMIDVDLKHSIDLMQQQDQTPTSSSSFVSRLQSCTITDINSSIYDNTYYQKQFSPSSRIRLGLRCLCPLDDKQKQLFDEIFSNNEQTTNISERILDECTPRLTKNSCNTLLILCGNSREGNLIYWCFLFSVHQLQTTILSSTLIRLETLVNRDQDKNLTLRISAQEYLNHKSPEINHLLSSRDSLAYSRNETLQSLNKLCSDHRHNPLLITFHLIYRSTNTDYTRFHILLTNDNDNEIQKEKFSEIFTSLALSVSSNRQKTSSNITKKRNLTSEQSLSSFLREYLLNNAEQYSKDFLYIFAIVKNDKQLKYWIKIQRLLRIKKYRCKMSRDSTDSSSVETVINRNNEEIWIDGPLSTKNPKSEIWIDGPIEFYSPTSKLRHKKSKLKPRSNSHRHSKSKAKAPILSPKHQLAPPVLCSTILQQENDEPASANFDSESVISSHCHLPVLPVFKDHTLLPFRSNQLVQITKPLKIESSNIDLRLSVNKLNDDMEMLEKTLETLLIPSPIVPNQNDRQSLRSQSLNRIDQLSSSICNDDITKRLSRIVSPTRFDKILNHKQTTENFHDLSIDSSVPNSPRIKSQIRQSRIPSKSTHPRSLLLSSTKKIKNPPESIRPMPPTPTRPSIFQRLFGLRSSSIPPPHPIPTVVDSPRLASPLTVTLDSHDDLMPLTTSSTASSASGRASSSGYESMSNAAFEELIASTPIMVNNENNSIRLRNKSMRKDERRSNPSTSWNSPILRDKALRQQRVSLLKHRQNELKLELATAKTFLLMDKSKNCDLNDSRHSTMNNSSMHTFSSHKNEENLLEREIENLERRLTLAKSQLAYGTLKKNKQFIS
ncbi:unnamed protein product [Rotaria magnacalcarata]